MVRLTYSNLSW